MPRKRKPGPKRTGSGRPPGSRNKKLNPKIEQAIDLIEAAAIRGENLTITDAAKQVGLSRHHLSRTLNRDDIAARSVARARQMLGGGTVLRAAARMNSLLTAESEYVQLDASKHVLAIAGIKPKEQGTGSGGKVSISFNLSHIRPGLVDVTPSMQITQTSTPSDDTE